MLPITNKKYRLPKIFAIEFLQVFSSGANMPVLVRGIDVNDHSKGDFVVKLKASERMGDPSANLREILAAFMAKEMEIPVVEPVIIDISEDFVKTVTDLAVKSRLQNSIGSNFGTRYLGDYSTLSLGSMAEKLIPFAQTLFAFDLLIQNSDRNRIKPNVLTNGEEIVALDHETAFGFTFAPFLPYAVDSTASHN